jgi:hypothetical protein
LFQSILESQLLTQRNVSIASYITGTNPIELHSFEEILATATMKNLDTGEQKPLSEFVKELPKVCFMYGGRFWCVRTTSIRDSDVLHIRLERQ